MDEEPVKSKALIWHGQRVDHNYLKVSNCLYFSQASESPASARLESSSSLMSSGGMAVEELTRAAVLPAVAPEPPESAPAPAAMLPPTPHTQNLKF